MVTTWKSWHPTCLSEKHTILSCDTRNLSQIKKNENKTQREPVLKPKTHKHTFPTIVCPPFPKLPKCANKLLLKKKHFIHHPQFFTVISKNNGNWEQFPAGGKQQNVAHGICPIVRGQRQSVNGTFPSGSKHRGPDNTLTRNRAARSLVSLSSFCISNKLKYQCGCWLCIKDKHAVSRKDCCSAESLPPKCDRKEFDQIILQCLKCFAYIVEYLM